MKRKLRDIAAAALGLCLIALGFIRKKKKEILAGGYITCIYFHDPPERLFRKCVDWLLKNGFTVITGADLLEILRKKKTAPPRPVWISLDDGWIGNMKNVVPYAAANKIPLTFFISTEPVENSGSYWWNVAEKYRHELPYPFNEDINKLWKVPENKRAVIINKLRENAEVKNSSLKREAMTVDDVKKISGNSLFTLGSHTVNHVITPNCTDEELEYEFRESKRKLEEWTGKKINMFCFPNGDHSGREEEILRNNGYIAACVQEDKFIGGSVDLFEIPRFCVGEGYFPEELCHMFGIWQNIMKKLKLKG